MLGDKPICFLIGAAGMGKSTIASEFCRRYEEELGASFFFKRNDANVGSTRTFFTTLAYQLAHCSWKDLRSHIAQAAERHSQGGHSQQMEYAVKDLLDTPLKNAEDAGSVRSQVFIVVDALDECTESSTQPDLIPECLRLLVCCALRHPSTFRLLLTSRPVPNHVEKARLDSELENRSLLLSLYDIEEQKAIDRDIRKMIQTRLCVVEEGKQWHQSDPTVVSRLTGQSQGVFVYARTAVDFVAGGTGLGEMKDRLNLILTPHNQYGLDHLDELYRIVLETAFPIKELYPKKHEQVRVILAWVALSQNSDGIIPWEVEQVSGIPCAESIPIILRLRSMLKFEVEDLVFHGPCTPFRAMHVTFRDFLVDEARCGDHFYVDPGLMHARIATGIVTKLHMNISGTSTYGLQYWYEHTKQAAPTNELVGIFKTLFTSLLSSHPSEFCAYCLSNVPSLHTLMDRQVIDRDIIGPAIHLRLCATTHGAQCYKRDPTIVPQLAEKAEGMWVYVYTALQFICAGADTSEMEHRIQLVLAPHEKFGLRHLTLLFRTVLECEFPPGDLESVTREHVQHLLAWMALMQNCDTITLSAFVALSGIPIHNLTSILTKLRPVLRLSSRKNDAEGENRVWDADDDQDIGLIHHAFYQFLLERAHSGVRFHVDPGRRHASLAVDCLRLLHNQFNKNPGFAERYARSSWAKHVQRSASSTEDLTDLLNKIFSSVSTSQPSFFFSYEMTLWVDMDSTIHWVDEHIVSDSNYATQGFTMGTNLLVLIGTGPGTCQHDR